LDLKWVSHKTISLQNKYFTKEEENEDSRGRIRQRRKIFPIRMNTTIN